MRELDVIALGEVLIDYTDAGTSASGQKLFEQNPGGAPANVLVALTKFGRNCAFIGKVGADLQGSFLKDTLEHEGIDCSNLIVDSHYFTTLAFVSLDNGERSFAFARKPGADTQISAEEISEELIKSAKLLQLGSLSLTHEPARSATKHALALAKKHGLKVSYDPNWRPALWESADAAKEQMLTLLPDVDILKVSEEELELLTGNPDLASAAQELLDKGPKICVVTQDERGCYLATKDRAETIPSFKVLATDTTGAGDSFWGGFLHALLKETDYSCSADDFDKLVYAARFGNATASLCVQKRGAIPAMPDLDEVLAVLQQD